MKTFKDFITEAKNITIDVDFDTSEIDVDKYIKDAKRKLKINIDVKRNGTALITGDKKDLYKFLSSDEWYGMDKEDIEDVFPEVLG